MGSSISHWARMPTQHRIAILQLSGADAHLRIKSPKLLSVLPPSPYSVDCGQVVSLEVRIPVVLKAGLEIIGADAQNKLGYCATLMITKALNISDNSIDSSHNILNPSYLVVGSDTIRMIGCENRFINNGKYYISK